MRLTSFVARGEHEARLGIITEAGIIDATESTGLSSADFFARGFEALTQIENAATGEPVAASLDELDLAPVIPKPGKIICVGLNYARHALEAGLERPREPVLFSKFNNSLAAPGAAVNIAGLSRVDYEAELGIVLGRGGRNISEREALQHVLGCFNANDISERGLQNVSTQWLLGKSLDGFLPIGPEVLTLDEAGDPDALQVRGWLNGELRQDSNTADMIFSVAEIIAYISRFMTLDAGDIIVTGTPEGVILGREDREWVKPGDEFTIQLGNLTPLVTRFT